MSLIEILLRANPPEDARATVEFEKMRFELSWRYFDFHARQRTQLFHFYIILSPFMLGGCFYLFKERISFGLLPSILAATVGAILSLIFWGLDCRNKQLIRISERSIKLLERDFLFKSDFRPLTDFEGIFRTEEQETKKLWFHGLRTHSFLVGAVYWLAFASFAGSAAYFRLL